MGECRAATATGDLDGGYSLAVLVAASSSSAPTQTWVGVPDTNGSARETLSLGLIEAALVAGRSGYVAPWVEQASMDTRLALGKWDRAGALEFTRTLNAQSLEELTVAPAPDGATLILRNGTGIACVRGCDFVVARWVAPDGVDLASFQLLVDDNGPRARAAVTRTGALVVILELGANGSAGALSGMWIARTGQITPRFKIADCDPCRSVSARALIDGTVAVRVDGRWISAIHEGAGAASAAPAWLASTGDTDLAVVRSGRGYAVTPRAGGAVLLFDPSGSACGRIDVPGDLVTVEPGGTVISRSRAAPCDVTWWPGLLRD